MRRLLRALMLSPASVYSVAKGSKGGISVGIGDGLQAELQEKEAPLKALVIGGTGPTGHYIVNGLLRRGYEVGMLHSGKHEVQEIPATVEHIHTDPFSEDALRGAIGNRTFDLTVA